MMVMMIGLLIVAMGCNDESKKRSTSKNGLSAIDLAKANEFNKPPTLKNLMAKPHALAEQKILMEKAKKTATIHVVGLTTEVLALKATIDQDVKAGASAASIAEKRRLLAQKCVALTNCMSVLGGSQQALVAAMLLKSTVLN